MNAKARAEPAERDPPPTVLTSLVMGWADSCDDLNYPAPQGPHASTLPEWLIEERRRRAQEERFEQIVQRATARAQRQAAARGARLRDYSIERVMAGGLGPGELPIAQITQWRRVLDEAIPVSIEEVVRSLGDVGFVLERIAWDAWRQKEHDRESVSDIAYLLDAEDIVSLSIDGHQLGERFEFSVALLDEVAKLGVRYWSAEGDSVHDTTSRFVALALRLGV